MSTASTLAMGQELDLIYLALAWSLSIVLGAWVHPPPLALLCLLILPASVVLLWWRERRIRNGAVYVLAFLVGIWRFSLSQPVLDAHHVAYYNDQGTITLRGVLDADPDLRDKYTHLRVRVVSLRDATGEHQVQGHVLVQAPRYPYHAYGEEVEITGRLLTPPILDEFSYRDYLARQGIYSLLRYPQIVSLAQGRGHRFYHLLFALRSRAREIIAAILPEPEASLLMGILLGIESGIPQETMEAFVATGTVHILVISGFNLTLLAGLFVRLGTRIINRRYAIIVAFLGIVCYTLLVGASAPVVRAAIMVSVSLLAYWVGRPYQAGRGLAAAVIVMTAMNPHLLWDRSFQLSMTATLGLIVLAPLLARQLNRWLSRWLSEGALLRFMPWLNELLIASIAAQLATTPVILYHFQRLSLISLLTNLLILPAQPYIMISGGLATIVGLLWPSAGRLLAWIPWLLLTYTSRVVEWTARPAWASVQLRFSLWAIALFYALLLGGPWLRKRWRQATGSLFSFGTSLARHASTALAMGGLGAVCLLVWIAVFSLPDGRLHVHFLDVGQGDAILIELPEGQQLLIDGGPEPSRLLAALGRRMPFWDRHLDMVVLTHADMDHLGGLIPVLERYKVDWVVDGGFLRTNPPTEYWRDLAARPEVKALQVTRGMRFMWGGNLRIEVLHPGPQPLIGTSSDENNNSVVLQLIYGQVRFLFTGDIEAAAEKELLSSRQSLASAVLKVSHHGAGEATMADFLQAVKPQLAVISVGAENRHGHPAQAALQRLETCGARILRTDQQGTIEVVTNGMQLAVETSR